jgi:hypothetical protein
MSLVDATDLSSHARSAGYELCRFAIATLEDLHAVASAAEAEQAPVCFVVAEDWRAQYLLPAIERRARSMQPPVVLQFVAVTGGGAIEGMRGGCNSIIARHADAVGVARTCGVPVSDVGDAEVLQDGGVERKIDAVTARLRRSRGAGKGADAAACCKPWESVEHCIVYNYAGSEDDARAMMARGKAELAAIPGVTEVFVGRSVDAAAKYRYVWLVRFASRAVIDTYRTHPTHVAFADSAFRPFAKDRLSIDFEGT